ncbi:MAG: TVP38/TMEM64 family protein [Firmicutes bacterium]|nr:TVP38/TMEM64 family protein [Bacillota bacterium]
MSKRTSNLIKLGIVVAVVLLYLLVEPIQTNVKKLVTLFSLLDVSAIKAYILSFGIWAPVISFLLMVFQSVLAPLPAFVLTFANAALFGWIKGAALSWSSAMAGAVACFYIARFLGREVVEKLTSKMALENVDDFFKKYGRYAILICRLLPFVSFDAVSYAAGLTSMGFWEFFWATGVGQLPATLVYSYVGDMLVGGARMFVFGLFCLFAISILVLLLKKIFQNKKSVAS